MNCMDLKRLLLDQRTRLERKFEREKIIERDVPDLKKYLRSPNVLAILGVRRSGKSTLAEMLVRGSNYAYVNFDDDRLLGVKSFEEIERAIYELYGGEVDYFLFDEIHNFNGWELFVSRLREEGKKVIITGSNSQMLSGELSTHLTGRHVDFTLFPFSFSEYLRFKGVKLEQQNGVYTTLSESIAKSELENYIRLGGFPEVHKISEEMLQQIISDIIYKDIVYKLKIKRIRTFQNFALSLLKYYSSEISLNKIAKMLKLSINTVEEWFNGMLNAFLILTAERYSESPKGILLFPKKVYVVDPGIISQYLLDSSMGRIMENLVAIHLARKDEKLVFFKSMKNEVDFVTQDSLIQVTYAESIEDIPRRETESLREVSKVVKGRKKVIITWGYEDKIEDIEFIPLWKFLLS
ncbi:AAA family ATPase [Acidianus sulfidivorans JP7]|uniref:AAA family ATPase n=1 Tax=Acidianus sulfidivorans JP7 TaxID=619593 RepID=A0A2U9IJI6_9CREN|nr:ATP-binding protein [Acidianus sulfidivorans]AWR96126.1 AAA family ATPase [Acidianus sulfidivorans JP7]